MTCAVQLTGSKLDVESRTGALYCQMCKDFVWDPTLEELRVRKIGTGSFSSKSYTNYVYVPSPSHVMASVLYDLFGPIAIFTWSLRDDFLLILISAFGIYYKVYFG